MNDNDQMIFEHNEESQIDGIIPDGTDVSRHRPPHVVSVPVNKIMPHPKKARFILPLEIKERFHKRQLNCFEAGQEFIDMAAADPVLHNMVSELQRLGRSIEESGQILPVVGAWERSDMGDMFFSLYLGSRRFWGVVLNSLQSSGKDAPSLYALETSTYNTDDLSVLNIHQSSLSFVEQSRAVAGLVANRMGLDQDEGESDLDYLRKIFVKRRISRKVWKEVKEVFGLDQAHVQEQLNYLNLPDNVLYFAAAANMTEEDLQSLNGLDGIEQVVEIKNIYMKRAASSEDAPTEIPELIETRSEAELITEAIKHWFELSEERGSDKSFLDVGALLMEQLEDDQELERMARRLINLARDIRVTKTRI